MALRYYQEQAVNSVYHHLRTQDNNPCIVLPTGTGKSHVMAQIVHDVVSVWNGRVLILAHVKELLEQNAEKISLHAPDVKVGIYSAGLNSRDTEDPVIVAGIQSVYQRAPELGFFNLVIVDEAHLIPTDGEGMYRQFIQDTKAVNPAVRVIGLTATPYRLKGGEICAPDNILNHVCYEAGLKEMILKGYLSPLKSRNGKKSVPDMSQVHIRGGEYVANEMAEAFDKDYLVRTACQEIVDLTKDRNSVLIFAASVAHAQHVTEQITKIAGQECGLVTGDTPPSERAELVARFKGEIVTTDLFAAPKKQLKFLVNVRVFTTGFDATNVDCVVMLFSTASTGLYVQVVGRGTRLHPGKSDCLVLDYGQNVMRHGPVDAVTANGTRTTREGQAPTKECKECGALIHAAYQLCPECGAQLPEPPAPTHGYRADGTPILSGEATEETYEVSNTFYSAHTKKGADAAIPKTLRVEYQIGANFVSEWVCPEHTGWARNKFAEWWSKRSITPPPVTAVKAAELANNGALAGPLSITVRHVSGEAFDRVIDYELGPIPDYYPEPGWNDGDLQPATSKAWDEEEDENDDIPF